MLHKLGYEYKCETCEKPKTDDEMVGGDECMDCYDIRFTKEYAYWKPLYDAEKAMGLLDLPDKEF